MEGLSDAFLALEEDYVECKRTINNCVNELAQNESGSGMLLLRMKQVNPQLVRRKTTRCSPASPIELGGSSTLCK